MRVDTPLVASLAAGAAIGTPSLGAVALWLGTPGLYPSGLLEDVVFAMILFRAALFSGVPRFRRVQTGTAIVAMSGDVLVLPASVALYYLTGDSSFAALAGAYLGAWLSAALLIYTPVAGLAVAEAMRHRGRVLGVVPGAAGAYVMSAFVLVGVGSASGSQGLSALVRLTIGNLKGAATPASDVSLLLLGCGVLLFASLAAYSVTAGSERGGMLVQELTAAVTGALALAGWVQVTSGLPAWEAFGVPAAVIVGVIGVVTREG